MAAAVVVWPCQVAPRMPLAVALEVRVPRFPTPNTASSMRPVAVAVGSASAILLGDFETIPEMISDEASPLLTKCDRSRRAA